MKINSPLLLAFVVVLLASISAGIFIKSALAVDALIAFSFSIPVFLIAWIAYSHLISRFTNQDFSEALVKDSLAFLPFIILLFVLINPFSSVPNDTTMALGINIAGLAYNLFTKLLLVIALSLFVFLKVLVSLGKIFDSGKFAGAREMDWKIPLIAAIAVYFVVFLILSYLRYFTFKTPAPDLWIFNQAMWNTLHGNFMVTTRTLELGNQVLLGDHFFLILLFILPVYALMQNALSLYFIQTVFISIAALPIFMLARKVLNCRFAAFAIAVSYLLYPALQFINLAEFQAMAFVIPLMLFAFYYLYTSDYRKFAVFLFFSLAVRETVAVVAFFLGIYAIFAMGKKKIGMLICAVSVIWFLLAVFVAIPALGRPYQYIGGTQNPFFQFGDSPAEVIGTMISNPLMVIKEATTAQDIGYLLLLFVPVAFLSLLSGAMLVPASTFALNLLSAFPQHATIYFQYNAELIPFVFIAAIFGYARLKKFLSGYFNAAHASRAIALSLLSFSILSAIFFGPSPLGLLDFAPNEASFNIENYTITPHHVLLLDAISEIPQEAVVSTDSFLAAHLSSRREVYYFPENLEKADYVLVDTTIKAHASAGSAKERLQELLNDADYKVLVNEDGVILLRKA
ncbi:MAG: DUF2079 domain-containing protein [Candidatus Diapherotrites archaeon]|nr:DUF2079 domain-containing protein [Candidatus Diapherotrites archaeon]